MTRPNLLFIQTDQQKATSLDLYSSINAIATTNLRDLANEGSVFETAYCPYPLCVPSRISTLTGRYPSSIGYIGNKPTMGNAYPSIFSQAKGQGCQTFLIGKDHGYATMHEKPPFYQDLFDVVYAVGHNGKMTVETNRDQPYIEPWLNSQDELFTLWGSAVAPWDGEQSISARLCDLAVEHLEGRGERGRGDSPPFAMWLSFPDPHELYQAPRDVFDSIDPDSITLYPNREPGDWAGRAQYIQFMQWYFNAGADGRTDPPPEDVQRKLIRVYLAMCKNVDNQLGKVFDCLKRLGEWENTLIVYCSDHGDLTGEHGLLQKFNCGYDGCCRVPLIVAWPGRSAGGRRSAQPVNLTDLPATLCELLGWPSLEGDQGVSFAPLVTGEADQRRPYTVVESGLPGEHLTTADIKNFPEHRWDRKPRGRWCYDPPHRFGGKMYAVRSERYKLIVREEDAAEFYDMQTDPWEMTNLAARADQDATIPSEMLAHFQYLAEHLGRIAPRQPGVEFAAQDKIYRAGGDKTWEECLAQT